MPVDKKEVIDTNFKMVAKTLFGLEEVLSEELTKLGAREIEIHSRAVSFKGDKGFMYKANLCCRTALRILKPIRQFFVPNEQVLYDQVKKIDWEEFMNVEDTLAVDCSLNSEIYNHTLYVAQKVKDAIVDRFREKYNKRPSVDKDRPTLRVNVHIHKDSCTISLDSSGEALYKRGYRDNINKAPINEVLAAGLVLLTGWDKKSVFIDPMCGSATISIEAALIANNIPPGYFRKEFGFELWEDFDKTLWNTIYDAAVEKINNNNCQIMGSDMSRNIIKKAKENVKNAKVEDVVSLSTSTFEELDPPSSRGVVVMNPPYGERMDKDNMDELYKSIGDTLKKKYSGYDAWIISSNMDALKHVGLRPSRKITLYNGQLECKFMKYQMYQGTKKVHKLINKEKEE